MNQSQFLAITCNSPEAREISRVHGAIGFVFASHWLKNWRESFQPITKGSNRNHVITCDSHLRTGALSIRPKIPEIPGCGANGTDIFRNFFPKFWVYLARLV